MVRFIQFFVLSNHRIQNGQQLAHISHKSQVPLFWPYLPSTGGYKTPCSPVKIATIAAMCTAVRTPARPPKMVRRLRIVPESRLTGATLTSALVSMRDSLSNSGISANRATTVIAPTPLMVLSLSASDLE